MSIAGIIPNPASGRDIRRLVAHGSVFDNLEKVNIVRRILMGLAATPVRQVLIMPDWFGIGHRALEGLQLHIPVSFLDMPLTFTQEDSTQAARLMGRLGARCVITLGGDGTNRAVAKESAEIPLVPISTGTNNVFPAMVEGTLAGLAAGIVAGGELDVRRCLRRARQLEVERDGQLIDIALVDVTVCDELFVGARAIWDTSAIREVFLAEIRPGAIGLSSLGAALGVTPETDGAGMWVRTGTGPRRVLAPVLPGVVTWVGIERFQPLRVGEVLPIRHRGGVLALDGEREIVITPYSRLAVRLSMAGPWVVDVQGVLALAARAGYFVTRRAVSRRKKIVT